MSFFQRLCSAPFPPVSCPFPEPHPDPQGCLYNLLERRPENSCLGSEILYNISPFLNPLILPNTGHTGDLGDTQTPVRGIPGGHHALTCLGIGLQKVVMPQPVRGSSSARGPRKLSASTCPGTQSSGGCHASTCPGILSLGGCHASVCLGICTLTWGRLALRLQQLWVGRTYIIYIPIHSGQNKPLNSTQHW